MCGFSTTSCRKCFSRTWRSLPYLLLELATRIPSADARRVNSTFCENWCWYIYELDLPSLGLARENLSPRLRHGNIRSRKTRFRNARAKSGSLLKERRALMGGIAVGASFGVENMLLHDDSG